MEVMNILEAGIIEKCKVVTAWNTKAFTVAKSDGTTCRLVGDLRGVNMILNKLLHHTESCVISCSAMSQLTAGCLP